MSCITPERLVEAVKKSKVFVLLLTKSVLTRPWCLLEVYAALDADIPIVPIKVIGLYERNEYSYSKNADYLANLATNVFDQNYMQRTFGADAWATDAWEPINACIRLDEAKRLKETSSHGELEGKARYLSTPHGEGLTLEDVQDLMARKK